MENKKTVALNYDQIEKFNDYSCDLGTLKRAFNTVVMQIEDDMFDSSGDIICILYIIYSYIENLKKNFTEFLKECDILL